LAHAPAKRCVQPQPSSSNRPAPADSLPETHQWQCILIQRIEGWKKELGAPPMKRLYTSILGVALILCLTSARSFSQTIPNWAPNTAYAVGALVMYQSVEYKCIQAHTSQVGWEPPNVPALWGPVSGSPSPTPTPTATPTPAPTPTPTPTPPPGGGGTCAPAWNSSLAYCNTSTTTCNGGNKASKNGLNFTAQFWNQGQDPTIAGNAGPAGSGDPWFTGVACTTGAPTPTPTPTPTPKPTPTPTPPPPGSVIFAAYKDVTLNANFNTGLQQSAVTGTVQPVTSAMPNSTLIWSFATGTCDAESWAGITPAQEATNVQAFVNAGKKYIISTGGANGAFDCSSGQGLINFINRYNSPNLVGVDFDIELGQSQQIIDDLINATIAAEKAFPSLQFSFTIQSLGSMSANPITGGSAGTTVVNEIKRLGLGGNYVVNLMTFDYGSTNTNNCVVVNNLCDMGQSAIAAAQALNQQSGIPFSHIGVTMMIGRADTQDEVTSLHDIDTINAFVISNHLPTSRFWSFDRDTPNGTGGSNSNGNGAPILAYTHEYMSSLGVP
jgi:chitinase